MEKLLLRKRFLWLFLLIPVFGFSQGVVSGNIIDASYGGPLAGVNVVIKGTSTGTTSDFDGNYEISVDSFPTTLVFSSLGSETKEIDVTGPGILNVSLAESATGLDEVVVTGLGTSIKRANLANAGAVFFVIIAVSCLLFAIGGLDGGWLGLLKTIAGLLMYDAIRRSGAV